MPSLWKVLRRPLSFNGAATLGLRKAPAPCPSCGREIPLQWSRNFRVAESAEANFLLATIALGFNGAATLGLRKAATTARRPCRSRCFNGAATLGLRKAPQARAPRPVQDGFNGAATLGLRKGALASASALRSSSLQWSRNFRVAESLWRATVCPP